ncbi:sulfite exporter TauE/SafE family protein [Roseivivax sp. CAU 1761]
MLLSILVLAVAGLAAGALNAVAGGGTFLSFPALVWVGVPPLFANATATLAALPGYISSAWAYRHDMRAEGPLGLKAILWLAVLGGFLGALLLLVTPQELFTGIVPWLLLLATVAFAGGPALLRRATASGRALGWTGAAALILAVTIYGGYFNGGLGIMLLAAFGLVGFRNLHGMNGLKNGVSAVLSTVSVATYIAAGLIDWPTALVIGLANAAGGWLGAHLARRVTNMALLRGFIIAVGLAMAVAFFTL